MNIRPVHIILVVLLVAAGIAYRTQILLKPTFTCIILTENNHTPEYLKNIQFFALDSYIPKVVRQSMNKLEMATVIHAESTYKIVTPEDFDPTHIDSCIKLSTLDLESHFIHAALGEQVPHILDKFFKDKTAVLLLELNQDALNNANLTLRKEQNKPDGQYFPHLYGPQKLPVSVIKTVADLEKAGATWKVNTLSIIIPNNLK